MAVQSTGLAKVNTYSGEYLFVTQRDHWINSRRPAAGNVTGQHHHRGEQQRGRRKDDWVGCADPEQQARHDASHGGRPDQADD